MKEVTLEEKEARKIRMQETKLATQGIFVRGDDVGNKYRAVRGILLRNAEVAKWESQRFIDFFDFLDRFYAFDKDEKGKISCTIQRIQIAELEMKEENCPYIEFMFRIDRWTEPFDGDVHKKFYIRLANLMRIVIRYCKFHPAVLTEELRNHIKDKPQYSWCLTNYKTTITKVGAEVVDSNTMGFQGNTLLTGMGSANADQMMLESIVKVASVYDMIASSISKRDIEKLNIKDKINALQKLSFIHSVTKSFKPNSRIFQQINVYKAGKDELEKAIMDFQADDN